MPASDMSRAHWTKSSYSGNNGGNCVEVAFLDDGHVAVRDTKDQGTGPILTFRTTDWAAFIDRARGGEFDPTH